MAEIRHLRHRKRGHDLNICVTPFIVKEYHRERQQAETGEEKRRVWRTYARALIEELQRPIRRHALNAPLIVWRRAACDDELPIAYRPFWSRLAINDLQELWLALERARHRASYD